LTTALPLGNAEIAEAFAQASVLLDLVGEDAHRVRSFASVARTLEALPRPAAEMLADGSLLAVKGVGEKTEARVRELVSTGRLGLLDELRAKVPAGVLECLAVPGLGAKKMRAVWQGLGVASLVELEYACLENRLRDLEGFGAKSQENVLKGIGFLKRSRGRRLLSQARAAAERVLNRLQREESALRLSLAGDARRWAPTVTGVELVATAHDEGALLEAFATMPIVASVAERSPSKARVVLEDGTPVSLEVVPEEAFVTTAFARIGSAAHVEAVKARAAARGLRLSDDGLWRGGDRVPLETDADLYAAVGLPAFPPELREDGDLSRPPPDDLVAPQDVAGILHAHSTWSDGSYSVERMATKAAESGFRWFAICDHSRTAAYANGLSIERVEAQWAEVDALNASGGVPVPVLKGVESDVLPDGSLDYPPEVLAGYDVVVGSVHSSFGQPKDAMTERLVRAVSNPFLHVLGHPSGRLLLGREGYAFDVERVLDACAEHGTAIELNANPHRLDLDERWLEAATSRGVRIAIDPDAHDLQGIDDVVYGVGAARRGRVRRGDVLTALEVDEFRVWCKTKRARATA
jgi:DNA polymerase (family 10)